MTLTTHQAKCIVAVGSLVGATAFVTRLLPGFEPSWLPTVLMILALAVLFPFSFGVACCVIIIEDPRRFIMITQDDNEGSVVSETYEELNDADAIEHFVYVVIARDFTPEILPEFHRCLTALARAVDLGETKACMDPSEQGNVTITRGPKP